MKFDLKTLVQNNTLFSRGNSFVSGREWLEEVECYRRQIRQWLRDRGHLGSSSPPLRQHFSVMLFSHSAYVFSVRLFALALEEIDVILPPNDQSQTLSNLAPLVKAFAGDSENAPADLQSLEQVDVNGTSPSTLLWDWPQVSRLIFFTSGTSGEARPVKKHWYQINCELNCLAETFKNSAETVLSTVSHQHIYGLLFKLLLPLRQQCCITEKCLYPEDIARQLKSANKASLVCSPAFLTRLSQDNVLIPYADKIDRIFSSGAPLPNSVALLLYHQLNLPVTQIYGSTETGGIAQRAITAGETPWRVLGDIRVDVAQQQRLVLHSPFIFRSPMLLDDRGEIIDEKLFKLLGRADRTVKIEDKRLSLDALENVLHSHPWIESSRLVMLTGSRKQLGAVVVLTVHGNSVYQNKGKRPMVSEIKRFLLEQFEPVCLPRKWRFVQEMPYNEQSKLSFCSLEALFEPT